MNAQLLDGCKYTFFVVMLIEKCRYLPVGYFPCVFWYFSTAF